MATWLKGGGEWEVTCNNPARTDFILGVLGIRPNVQTFLCPIFESTRDPLPSISTRLSFTHNELPKVFEGHLRLGVSCSSQIRLPLTPNNMSDQAQASIMDQAQGAAAKLASTLSDTLNLNGAAQQDGEPSASCSVLLARFSYFLAKEPLEKIC